ncbi:hypothetical protein D3C73_769680 [compost metagenome]
MVGNWLYACRRGIGSRFSIAGAMVYNTANVFGSHDHVHIGNAGMRNRTPILRIADRAFTASGWNWINAARVNEHDPSSLSTG